MRSGVRVSWVARLDTPPALLGRGATRTGAGEHDAGHRCRIVARGTLSRQDGARLQLGGERPTADRSGRRGVPDAGAEERQQRRALVGQGRRIRRPRAARSAGARAGPRPRPRSRSTRHVPATNPSTVNVLIGSWVTGAAARATSAVIARVRSAYDSSMFSKSYRKRGGAGRVGIRPRRVRQVEQLASGLVAERHEAGPEAVDDLGQPGQAAPRLDVHDAGRPERAQVAEDQRIEVRPVGRRRPEPRLDRGVGDRPAPAPQAAGRDLDERARPSGPAARARRRSRSGQRVSRWSPSALNVRGSASTKARPIATTSSRSTPTRRLPNWPFWTRSRTGWTSGRRPHASRAVTMWIVPRMSASRTTRRSTMRSDRSSGRNPSSRDHSAV